MPLDQPRSKLSGVPRFGKNSKPPPGTLEWYRRHMPDRLNNTKITVRDTGGFTDQEAELIAVRILRWNESPLARAQFGG